MNPCMVYITVPNLEEAEKICRSLLEKRLVACVNIFDNMKSHYWWKDQIESATEVVVIGKTKQSLVDELVKEVKELHSYECPCIVSIPITGGSRDFLGWLEQETRFKVV